MSKRTREQQDEHNRRRREIKQQGRQGVFTMEYLRIMHPEIYDEVNKFYEELREKYPKRLRHINTKEFRQLEKKSARKTVDLEPQLNIYLLPSENNQATTNNTYVTEDPPVAIENLETEEIERIIRELRNDPDLMYAFNDITIEDPVYETTVETTQTEGSLPIPTVNEEIDKIVTELYNDAEFMEAFAHWGEDLPELNDDDIFW